MTSRTRVFAAFLLAVAAAGPPVDAQQAPKITRIGYLSGATSAVSSHFVDAFRQGLRELGYAEGKTVVLEVRYSEGRVERLPELARELVGLKVDVIVTGNDAATAAVRRETQTIPIVMETVSTRSAPGWWRPSRARAETSLVSAMSLRNSAGSGWSC